MRSCSAADAAAALAASGSATNLQPNGYDKNMLELVLL